MYLLFFINKKRFLLGFEFSLFWCNGISSLFYICFILFHQFRITASFEDCPLCFFLLSSLLLFFMLGSFRPFFPSSLNKNFKLSRTPIWRCDPLVEDTIIGDTLAGAKAPVAPPKVMISKVKRSPAIVVEIFEFKSCESAGESNHSKAILRNSIFIGFYAYH